jgi:hypothetical protein
MNSHSLDGAKASRLTKVALPPHEIDDRIERYRTANTRKMDRSLSILETIRRLKKEA